MVAFLRVVSRAQSYRRQLSWWSPQEKTGRRLFLHVARLVHWERSLREEVQSPRKNEVKEGEHDIRRGPKQRGLARRGAR